MDTMLLTTGMRKPTAAEQAENLRELLAYAAGWIADPGTESGAWDPLHDNSLTLDDEEGADSFGPTDHECHEPRVGKKAWRAMRGA
jgi:hypothetical protein